MAQWTKNDVIYQIYPLSFQDSNDDGFGDLQGIINRLDYLKKLGVDAVWLSPVYRSPLFDFGYDVSDHCNIDPVFGDLKIFDCLVRELHARGMKIMMDYIPNHTSSNHPWFLESRSSKNNPKRDWYVWKDPGENNGPPNNWVSVFGGSSWEYDKTTKQYYFHQFLKEQPDLNWRNPQVQKAMLAVLDFWMKRGVDGFRIDALFFLFEDKKLRNDPANSLYHCGQDEPLYALKRIHDYNQPEVSDFISQIFNLTRRYPAKLLVSEIPGDISTFRSLYRVSDNAAHIPFNFSLMDLSWDPQTYRIAIESYLKLLGADFWPNFVLGNHDQPRIATRHDLQKARALALLQLTLPGLSFIYYGDELGMENSLISSLSMKDLYGIRVNSRFCRDGERNPMQWTSAKNAGFSNAAAWIPVSPSYKMRNVETEKKDTASMLNLYKELIRLKKENIALREGDMRFIEIKNRSLLAYERVYRDVKVAIVINFSGLKTTFSPVPAKGRLIFSTAPGRENELIPDDKVILGPKEGIIIMAYEKN